ncbi:Sushi domain protein [Trichostrongylus colubriformis]|uniref:Sushi domain protein n=1 Tax=Trichostrongylus colubriformis TaxID=6319 RepID=A0AAN8IPB7_TRICO
MRRLSFCLAVITGLSSRTYGLNCPPVAPPLGGTTSFTGEPREGSVAFGQCPLGQILNGPVSITCTNGLWNPPAFGICSPSSTGGGGLGMTATGGLGIGLPGLPGAGLGNGLGTPGGLGTGGVGTAQCPPMLAPAGSTISYSSGATSTGLPPMQNSGSTATMRCNDNSLVSGASVATCQNGQWQPPTLGTCTMNGLNNNNNNLGLTGPGGIGTTNVVGGLAGSLPCPVGVIPPLNGNVVYSAVAPYPQGTTATLTCNPGFVVSGQSTVSCQNGLFGVLGTCNKIAP